MLCNFLLFCCEGKIDFFLIMLKAINHILILTLSQNGCTRTISFANFYVFWEIYSFYSWKLRFLLRIFSFMLDLYFFSLSFVKRFVFFLANNGDCACLNFYAWKIEFFGLGVQDGLSSSVTALSFVLFGVTFSSYHCFNIPLIC